MLMWLLSTENGFISYFLYSEMMVYEYKKRSKFTANKNTCLSQDYKQALVFNAKSLWVYTIMPIPTVDKQLFC